MAHARPFPGRSLALAALLAAGCDIPTEPPDWDTEWEFPLRGTRVAAAELLPAGVQVAPGGEAFLLALAPVAVSRTLGEICGAPCAILDGRSVPKPGFTFTFTETIELPSGVASATLTGGSVELTLLHDFSFDPLRPPGAARSGSITAAVLHGGAVLGEVVVEGATTPFPPNATLSRTLSLRPATLTGPLTLRITLDSPASGEPVVVETSDRLTATAAPTDLRIAGASVTVQDEPVTLASVVLDLADVDEFVADHAKRGALILEIDNPFAVAGVFELRLDTPTGPITETVAVEPGTRTVRVELSGEEVRRILGNEVVLRATGRVSGTGGPVAVSPGQELVLESRLELILGPEDA